jgi:hypothetical protein
MLHVVGQSKLANLASFPCKLLGEGVPVVISSPARPGSGSPVRHRHLEIRIRWEHQWKRTCADQAGDSREQEFQAD